MSTDGDCFETCQGHPVDEDAQRKPLTALEWLRVTHADTLSGRHIEEAIATERAAADQLRADVEKAIQELEAESRAAKECAEVMPRTDENVRHHAAERRHARVAHHAASSLRAILDAR